MKEFLKGYSRKLPIAALILSDAVGTSPIQKSLIFPHTIWMIGRQKAPNLLR